MQTCKPANPHTRTPAHPHTRTHLHTCRYGLRKLELFFALLITVMATSFGYEYVVAAPDQAKVVEGLLLPECPVSHQILLY